VKSVIGIEYLLKDLILQEKREGTLWGKGWEAQRKKGLLLPGTRGRNAAVG
jgi:hypothetical protein